MSSQGSRSLVLFWWNNNWLTWVSVNQRFQVFQFLESLNISGKIFIPRHHSSEKYRMFLSICAALQRSVKEEPIFIPVDTFSKPLAISPKMVSVYRTLGVRQGYLELVSPAVPHRYATKYYFLASSTTDMKDSTG